MNLPSSGPPMAFGISSYAFAWAIGVPGRMPAHPMTVWELLDTAKSLKAERLQLADNMPVHLLSKTDWQKLIRQAKDRNIRLELGLRGLQQDPLLQYLELATECGSPFLRVVIDSKGYEPGHDQIVGIIREVLPQFKAAGILLAIENHDRFRVHELVNIIEATDAGQVGICLDTANSLGADEGIYEVARVLAPYTVNLHVKDYRIRRFDHNMGFQILGTPAGQGQTPIKWLLEYLASFGKCQSATLEVWSTPMEDMEATVVRENHWATVGAENLKNYLSGF